MDSFQPTAATVVCQKNDQQDLKLGLGYGLGIQGTVHGVKDYDYWCHYMLSAACTALVRFMLVCHSFDGTE